MKQVQRGFTLIELVMVIVILGVLAAVAIPKFVDLKGDAATAATQGVAGALSSASAINYGARSINASNTATFQVTAAGGCAAVKANMQDVPASYAVSGTAPTCTVTAPTGQTASFTALLIN
jgi:prepilin-type N-terminal cleavage/methylation domain-containing protein